jgi:glycerophosphoryl diester phosphodiesterase
MHEDATTNNDNNTEQRLPSIRNILLPTLLAYEARDESTGSNILPPIREDDNEELERSKQLLLEEEVVRQLSTFWRNSKEMKALYLLREYYAMHIDELEYLPLFELVEQPRERQRKSFPGQPRLAIFALLC